MCWTLLFSFLLPLLFLDDNFLLNANEMRSAKRASGRLPSRWTWQKKRKKKKSSSRRWLESGDGQSIGASAAVCLGMGKKVQKHSRFVSPSANWVDGKQEAASAPSVTFFFPRQVCSSPKHVDGKNVMEVKLFAMFTAVSRWNKGTMLCRFALSSRSARRKWSCF